MTIYRITLALLASLIALALGCAPMPAHGGHATVARANDHRQTAGVHYGYRVVIAPPLLHIPVSGPTNATPATAPAAFRIDDAGDETILLLPDYSSSADSSDHATASASGVNDENARAPLAVKADGVTTGGTWEPAKIDTALLGLNKNALIVGGGLVLVGVVLLLLSIIPYTRALLPIPVWVGPALAACGGIYCWSPVLIDRYGWLIPVALGLIGIGAIISLAVKLGWFHRETSTDKIAKLKADGDHRAAGALTYLATGGDKLAAKVMASPMPTQAKPETPPAPPPAAPVVAAAPILFAIGGLALTFAQHLAS